MSLEVQRSRPGGQPSGIAAPDLTDGLKRKLGMVSRQLTAQVEQLGGLAGGEKRGRLDQDVVEEDPHTHI